MGLIEETRDGLMLWIGPCFGIKHKAKELDAILAPLAAELAKAAEAVNCIEWIERLLRSRREPFASLEIDLDTCGRLPYIVTVIPNGIHEEVQEFGTTLFDALRAAVEAMKTKQEKRDE